MDYAPQKRPGRQDNGARLKTLPISKLNTGYGFVHYGEINNFAFNDAEVFLLFRHSKHFFSVNPSISLRPGPLYGRTFATVQ